MTLILPAEDLRGLVPTAELIEAIRQIHSDLAHGQAVQPAPVSLASTITSSVVIPMVASSGRHNLSVVKVLTDAPENRRRHLPTQRSVIVVIDSDTGECIALIDGEVLTRERTAATTAMATDLLANRSASVLGVIGAGRLAVEHVNAIRIVRPLVRVHVWSRSDETIATFKSLVGDVEVHRESSPEEVVRASEILCTLTPSKDPIVKGAWFHPGLHVNAVGAPPRPDHREIDAAGMAAARLFVDSTSTQLAKSGDALLSMADGLTTQRDFDREIGAVIAGQVRGRTDEQEVTLFNSVGLAVQDLAYAALCLDRAKQQGLGHDADLKNSPVVDRVTTV